MANEFCKRLVGLPLELCFCNGIANHPELILGTAVEELHGASKACLTHSLPGRCDLAYKSIKNLGRIGQKMVLHVFKNSWVEARRKNKKCFTGTSWGGPSRTTKALRRSFL